MQPRSEVFSVVSRKDADVRAVRRGSNGTLRNLDMDAAPGPVDLPSFTKDAIIERSTARLQVFCQSTILRFDGGIAKIYPPPSDGRDGGPVIHLADIEHELRIIRLAGDCAVGATGTITDEGRLVGYTMPECTPIFMPSFEELRLSPGLPDRCRIIQDAVSLVRRLHARGIIHADIQPFNFLYTSEGELKLCDFEGATTVPESRPTHRTTPAFWNPSTAWASFSRHRRGLVPSCSTDIYALGITSWVIYTGLLAVDDLGQSLDDFYGTYRIALGAQPDLSLIDNEEIRDLISSLLTEGADSFTPPLQLTNVCSQRKVEFSACRSTPHHFFIRHVPCEVCAARDNCELGRCLNPYADEDAVLKLPTIPSDIPCAFCTINV
ncbi:hypothetical protein EXIGLDRAFT_839473 [Exidia glandulosa HHB12029]|uniref:Protein kinase domain-containing protein n=1 Tax=Exidia glandulosa HHB12029 TaxID=1314781 RepID=A0A165F0Z2_EXIGL|nr:hypothetical protein EXIGLDRAFT_839473 [Exidia glandulosa HHB12029]